MITCKRDLFEIPHNIAYLNCAYLSPMMKSVQSAGIDGVKRKSRPWEIRPEHFFHESEEVRGNIARLISASIDDIALIPSCSYGLAVAAANIELDSGDEILLLDEQFPSNVYPWHDLARQKNAALKTVTRQTGKSWTDAILQAISGRTRVVTIPNVHWTDGTLIDLDLIAQSCRKSGVKLVLDVTQSLGAYPLSVREIKPDFMVCACYKWLLGPYSTAFLYVAPEFHGGRPIENNWLNRKGSEDFAKLVKYQSEFQTGARRYDVGERSNFTLMPMVNAALRQIHEWSVPEIRKTLAEMTEFVASKAAELGLQITPAEQRAGHMVGIRFPKGLPPDLPRILADMNVFVSVRGSAVRVSPHLYNNAEDLEKLIEAFRRVQP